MLTFAPGELRKEISVQTLSDERDENDESFRVVLFHSAEGKRKIGQAVITIEDDDPTSISISDAEQVTEKSGGTTATFTVSLSKAQTGNTTVNWKTLNGDGENPAKGDGRFAAHKDFQPVPSTTLTFAPGETSKQVRVTILDDQEAEPTETFRVMLENPVGATISRGTAYGQIADDDMMRYWFVNDGAKVREGKSLVVRVRRNRTATKRHFMRICLTGVNLGHTGDGGGGGTAVISNPFTRPDSIRDTENNGKDDARVVGRHKNTNDCSVLGEPGSFNSVTFEPEDLEKTFRVYTIQDSRIEEDETFTVRTGTGTSFGNYRLGQVTRPSGVFTILDDDARRIRVKQRRPSVWEGDQSIYDLYVEPTLASGKTATVKYYTSDGTAIGGGDSAKHDYMPAKGTLTLKEGSPAGTITVTVHNEHLTQAFREPEETFTLTLANPSSGLTLPVDETVETTILDDDFTVVFVDDAVVDEGDRARIHFRFSHPFSDDAIVTWETVTVADGAKTPEDFTAISGGTVTFAAGATGMAVRVATVEDGKIEDDENFQVRVTKVDHPDFDISSAAGTVTIRDDDQGGLMFSGFSDGSVQENEGWNSVTPTLTGKPFGVVTWTLEGADAASFRINARSGQVTLPAQDFEDPRDNDDDNVYEVTVRATDEDGNTSTQDLAVTVTDAPNAHVAATVRAQNFGTITEDSKVLVRMRRCDRRPEGLDWPEVSYNWYTARHEAGQNPAGDKDYEPRNKGSAPKAIPDNNTRDDSLFDIKKDDIDEPDETLLVVVHDLRADKPYEVLLYSDCNDRRNGKGPVPGGQLELVVSIADANPTGVTLAQAGSGGIAEDGGTEDITITLGRELVAGESVTVPLTVSGATVSTHYTLELKNSGNTGVSIDTKTPHSAQNPAVILSGAGAQTATLTLTAVANTDYDRRTVEIGYGTNINNVDRTPTSSGLDGGIKTMGSVSFPIIDDDAMITIANASAAEGGAVEFSVMLPEAAPAGGVTVQYSTSDGRGNDSDEIWQIATGTDYTAAAGANLTIAKGQSGGVISIATTDDNTYEGDHHFTVTLDSTDIFNISADSGSAVGTITDDDDKPEFAFSTTTSTAAEDTGTVTLTVEKTGATLLPARVSYATMDGIAVGGSDFTAIAATNLVFAAADTSKTFDVRITDDAEDEVSETFSVALTAEAGAVLSADSSHAVTITDNDETTVTLSVQSGNIAENNGSKTITVTLGRALEGDEMLSVPLDFSGSTATFGVDYGLSAPKTVPTGVTYSDLDSDDLTKKPPTVVFSGIESAARAAALTLTAKIDAIDEGESESVRLGLGKLGDAELDGGASGSGTANFAITDNDDASVTINESGGVSVTEAKGATNTDTYTVVLTSEPTAAVSITLESGDSGAATVSPATLTFATTNWGTVQTVTVTGVDDDVDQSSDRSVSIGHSASSSDSTYDEINIANVTAVVMDDDVRGVTVSGASGLSISEADDGSTGDVSEQVGSYTVVLESEPTGAVTVVASVPEGAPFTAAPSSLSFTSSNWSSAQTVTVTGVDDDLDNPGDERQATIRHDVSASGTDYEDETAASVVVTVTDDDGAGVTIKESDGSTSVTEKAGEGRNDTYTVVLDSQPTAAVTITLESDDSGAATVSPATLTFATTNWGTAQTVTVTGVDDDVDNRNDARTVSISHAASSTDTDYTIPSAGSVSVTVADDDEAGVTIAETDDETMVSEDGTTTTDTYTVLLKTKPTHEVKVTATAGAGAEVAAGGAAASTITLTFTTANWGTVQTVTVTGVDDDVDQSSGRSVSISHSASSSDPTYDEINIANVTAVVMDNDTAAVTINESGGVSVTEAKGATNTDTYTVVLTSEPTAAVSITLESGDSGAATVSPATLTFATTNWGTVQTVTVTGVDDDVDQSSDRSVSIGHSASSGDSTYDEINIANVTAVVMDDDVRGVTVSGASGLSISEADDGSTGDVSEQVGSYTVVLESEPTGAVTVVASVPEGAPFTAAPSSLSFTSSNWSSAQTVTVTGVDDDLDNPGDERQATIRHDVSASGTDYEDETAASVVVTVTDDDGAGVTIKESDGSTSVTEKAGEGRNDTYTVVLASQPTAAVTITLESDDSGAATVSPATLTFATTNWGTAQTVTVTGVDDDVDNRNDARTVSISHAASSTDTDYTIPSAGSVSVTVADDDEAGVTIAETDDETMVSEDGTTTTDTYTVLLKTKPTHEVKVTATAGAGAEVAAGGAAASTITLTFTTANWGTVQTVTVTGVDDDVDQSSGRSVSIGHSASSSDPTYDEINIANVTAVVMDNDTAAVTINESGGVSVTEAKGATNTDTYTVVLTSEPTAAVSITLESGDSGAATVSPATLTFATTNWGTVQTVTVTGVDDDVDQSSDRSVSISHSASSGDSTYDEINIANVTAVVMDDDVRGVTVSGSSGLSISEADDGDTDELTENVGSYTVVLESEPTGAVTVVASVPEGAPFTAAPSSLSFTSSNWSSAQTVTVTGVDDDLDNRGDERQATIRHDVSASGTDYEDETAASVVVTVTDDDGAGVTIKESDGSTSVTEKAGEGRNDTYTVVLASQPTAAVTITLESGDSGAATVSPATLTFATTNWGTAQTVTVTGVDDDVDNRNDARTVSISHAASSTDTDYTIPSAGSVSVTVADDDEAGVTIAETDDETTVSEDGTTTTDTYTVLLKTKPTHEVKVTATAGAGAEVAAGGAAASTITLTFTTANWGTTQTVTVTGVDDDVDQSSDRSVTISHSASSSDPTYDEINIANVTAVVMDNDTAAVTINESGGVSVTEAKGATNTDTYTVVLTSEPTAAVSITLESGDSGAATVSPATLTFTTTNWGTTQTVTVTGVDDDVDQSSDRSVSIGHSASSGDPTYGGIDISDVTAVVMDDDVRGVTVSGASGLSISEADDGSTGDVSEQVGSYTVVLESEPTGAVTVVASVPEGAPFTAAPSSLSFTSSNWSSAQTVTVTGVDDDLDNRGDERQATIRHDVSASGTDYEDETAASVVVTVTDDDGAGVTIKESDGSTSVTEKAGEGRNDTYTVVLASQPTAAVTITLESDDSGAATVSPATLTFATTNWGTAQTVTVTGVDDDVDNTNDARTVSISHSATSSDPTYGGKDISDVIAVVMDDGAGVAIGSRTTDASSAGVTINESDDFTSVTEKSGDGRSDTYTVVLESEPTAAVTITVESGDSGAATVSPATLTFATTNWRMAQTVTVTGVDDQVDQSSDRSVTISHSATSSDTTYDQINITNMTATVVDNDTASITINESGGVSVTEAAGEGRTDTYTVVLESEPTAAVTITVESGDSGAATVSPATLTFATTNWGTVQTVTVTGVDDQVDQSSDRSVTISHSATSSDAQYNNISISSVTATVVDDDLGLKLEGWHLRFGRTVSQQVVDALQDRFAAHPAAGLQLTVAGEPITSATPLEYNQGMLSKVLGFETVSTAGLVEGSSFSFAPEWAEAEGGVSHLAFWGQGALSSFTGQEDEISLDGDVTTALLGADWGTERWQAGAALSQSWGRGSHQGDKGADGEVSSTLTGLFPYGRYALTPRLGIWATAGYGWGELSFKPDGKNEYTPNTTMGMVAVGLDGVLLDGGSEGITLTTTADVLTVRTSSEEVDGLESSEGSLSRRRVGLEAIRPFPLSNGTSFLPSMALGIRHDSGDAETGFGLDLGAAILWKAPGRGISGELKGRTLLTHVEEEFQEQGLALSFSWEPTPSNRGPSLSLSHAIGATPSGGMDALLHPTTMEVLDATPSSGRQQFEAELAYGFPAYNNQLTLIPAVGLVLSPTSRNYSLLWSLTPYAEQTQGEPWQLSLEGQRQEQNGATSPVDHSLKLTFSTLF